MSTIPLQVSASAPFVSDGAGGTVARVFLGPQVYGSSWRVERVVASTTSATVPQSKFFLYLGNESVTNLIDSTNSGDGDTDELPSPQLLNTLDKLTGKWTGGTLGTIATMTITGIVDTGR